ncbi:hypothetical protein ACFVT5_39950 [Streptomyces sp. NPDC058001]|uniref:hypothetical protein n=1 Tax=Streptomyces sp. NPDC058001 TaxID=3346300 RepID=UPI0036F032E3
MTHLRDSVRKARPGHVGRPARPEDNDVTGERVSEPIARLSYLTRVIVEGRTKAIDDLVSHLYEVNMKVCITDQALGRAVPRAD